MIWWPFVPPAAMPNIQMEPARHAVSAILST